METGDPPLTRSAGGRWNGWLPLLVLGGSLAAWEGVVRLGVVSAVWLPPPTAVLATLGRSLATGEISAHLWATLYRVVPGLVLGAVPGLLLGLLMGWSPGLRRAVDPLVAALHPIPKIAVLPLFMLALGIGEGSRIAVIAVAAFFPVLIAAMAGTREISPLHFEVARNCGAGPLGLFRHVVVPGSLPAALGGLRISGNAALLVAIAVEIIAAERGLGALVWLSWEVLRIELLYATLLVIAVLGLAISLGIALLRRWLVPWAPESGSAA